MNARKIKQCFSLILSMIMVITSILGTMPLHVFANSTTHGNPTAKINYTTNNPDVGDQTLGNDLDNFTISMQYGTIGENLGDTLELIDATTHVPVTVNIEYHGENTYAPGEISFTMEDFRGVSRQWPSVDVGAEKEGSGTGRGDWYYSSERLSDSKSSVYTFTNKKEVSNSFTSSVEMITSLSEVRELRSGYEHSFNSIFSVADLGSKHTKDITIKCNTTHDEYEMKEFSWQPYHYNTYGLGDGSDEEFHGYSLSDYYVMNIKLNLDVVLNNRGYDSLYDDDPIVADDISYGRYELTVPDGVKVINTKDKEETFVNADDDPGWGINGNNDKGWYIIVPKSLYPDGTEIPVTARFKGKFLDTLEPFDTYITQNVKVIPAIIDVDGELFYPKKGNGYTFSTSDGHLSKLFVAHGGQTVDWNLSDFAPVKKIGVTKTVVTDSTVEWMDKLKQHIRDVKPSEYTLQSIQIVDVYTPSDGYPDIGPEIRVYVKKATDSDYTLVKKFNQYNWTDDGYQGVINLSEYKAQHFKVEFDGRYDGDIDVHALLNLETDTYPEFEEQYIHNAAKLYVESPKLEGGSAEMDFNCTVQDHAFYKLEPLNVNPYLYMSKGNRVIGDSDIHWDVNVQNYLSCSGEDLGNYVYGTKYSNKITYPSYVNMSLDEGKMDWKYFYDLNDPEGTLEKKKEKPEWVHIDSNTEDNGDGTKTTSWLVSVDDGYGIKYDNRINYDNIRVSIPLDVYSTLKETRSLPSNITLNGETYVNKDDTTLNAEDWSRNTDTYSLGLNTEYIAGNTYQGVDAAVKTDTSSSYSRAADLETVGDGYSYKFRLSGGQTELNNVVLYSNLEEAYGSSKHWKGTFNGIDTSVLKLCGCNPTVYYSTSPSQAFDLNDSGWIEADSYSGELSKVESIAVDLNDYKVLAKTSALVNINMLSSEKMETSKAYCSFSADYIAKDATTGQVLENIKALPSNVVTVSKPFKHIAVRINKVWDDNDNQDGLRPENIAIELYGNDEKIQDVTLSPDSYHDWSQRIYNLPFYDEYGEPINYSVKEPSITGYQSSVESIYKEAEEDYNDDEITFTVTNTHTPEKGTITVQKVWDDDNNRDNIRPDEIVLGLKFDRYVVNKTIKLNKDNNWTNTFEDVDLYDGGNYIFDKYEVTENDIEGYTKDIKRTNLEDKSASFTVTNTHKPDAKSISVTKRWDDNNNQDGIRPDTVKVQLYANNEKYGEEISISKDDDWYYTWNNLPVKQNGTEINYSVKEVKSPDGYTSTVTGNAADGFVITNKHTPESITVSGTKTWDDNNNQDGIRPEEITINLFVGDNKVDSKKVNKNSDWKYSFSGLPKYAEGKEIEYTITEEPVSGYTPSYDGYNITNTHIPETTTVKVYKTWDDNNNQDGIRPDKIEVSLLGNGDTSAITLDKDNLWGYTWNDLPKYKDGKEINYSVQEKDVPKGYTGKVNNIGNNVFEIVNSHTPDTITISGTKTWYDNDDQDKLRPESITIHLNNENDEVASKIVTANDNWEFSIENLPKNRDGKPIAYSITEDAVDGYEAIINKSNNKFNIINIHEPETTSISGTKIWNDNNNQDGIRPESVSVNLIKDGEIIATQHDVNESTGWTFTFDMVPRYEDGKTIFYYIQEADAPDGYETEIDCTDIIDGSWFITNTHVPDTISATVHKTWIDGDNQDGLRPDSVSVQLFANDNEYGDPVDVTAEDEWTYTWSNLPKFQNGEAIRYTIGEVGTIDGYDGSVEVSDDYNFELINEHNPETINISGTKTWNDDNNKEGIRPEAITVRLLANGKEVKNIEVTEKDEWKYSFANLPKYEAGKEIVYTITEDKVEGYTTEYDGFDIKNTHNPGKTSVTVTKTWDDDNNQDGIRPEEIRVILKADGKQAGDAVVLNEKNKWTYTWTELDTKANGKNIEYTVAEEEVPEGYTSSISGSLDKGYTITNTHKPEAISVAVTKEWDDNNNSDSIRPSKITVNLLANGEQMDTVDITEKDDWKATFDNLPKYKDGEVVKYTVVEEKVDGYIAKYKGNITDGFTITNTHKTEKSTEDSTNDTPPDNHSDSDTPTGDTTNTSVLILCLFAALALAGGIGVYRRKIKSN